MTNTKYKRQVAIYVRTSTSMQDNGAESQRLALKQWCNANGIRKFKVYEDKSQSGAKKSRPQLDKLIKDIKSGEVGTIVTYSLSRISRSLAHLTELSSFFNESDVTFVSLTESIDTSSAMGRLVYNILGSIAEFERETTSERVKTGMANAKAKGKKIGRVKTRNSKLIQELFKDGYSYRKIAERAECSLSSVQKEVKGLSR